MTDLSKFNGPFHPLRGFGNVLTAGDGSFALVPLALDEIGAVGIQFTRDDLNALIGMLVALQVDLETRAGSSPGFRGIPVIPLHEAKATTTIGPAGVNGLAMFLTAESKQPFAFGISPELAAALAKQLEQSCEQVTSSEKDRPN